MNLGGVPRFVYDLARAQSDKYRVTVITNRIEDTASEKVYNYDTVYLKNISRKLIYAYQFYTPILNPTLFMVVKEADILHFHGCRNLLNEIVAGVNRFFKRPSLITTHGTMMNYESKRVIKKIYDKFIGSHLTKSAKFIVAHSEVERHELLKMGIESSRMAVIPNGIYFEDLDIRSARERFCRRFGIDKKKRIVLFIGKITRRKGLDVSIEAVKRLKGIIDLQMVVAGDSLGPKVGNLVAGTDIRYIGHLDVNEKIEAIGASDLLLYPSIYETFGYVPFEAVYLNKPCIVGDDFGTAEHLSPAIPELIVSYGDAIELSEIIMTFLKDVEFTSSVVRRGREYILQNYSISREVEQYDKIYKKMLQQNGE